MRSGVQQKIGWALALGLACAIALSGCHRGAEHGNSIVVARPADFVSLDPAATVNASDGTIISLCYDRLTAIDPKSPDGAAIGDLAQSWMASPDGLTWTFVLKPGVTFADGAPVTASDVALSFQRVQQVNRAPAQGLFWLKSVKAVDPATVRFRLNMPFPVLPKILSLSSGSVVDTKAIAAHAVRGDGGQAWASEHCAGSGPYALSNWRRGQSLTLIRRPNAPAPAPYFQRVVFKLVPDAASRREELARGDIDLIDAIGAAEVEHYRTMPGVSLEISNASNSLAFLTLNVSRGVLSDVRVRKAIAKSIDYPALRDKVLRGNAILLNGLIPPGVPGYDPAAPEPSRDVAGARALLAAAGHPNGVDLSMIVGEPGPVAELIQANLADAGIRLRLQRMAPSAIDAARGTGDYEVFYDGWILDFPDPFIFLNLAFATPAAGGVGNFSHYANPAADGLLQAAMVEANPAKRTALYRQAQGVIMQDQPIVPLFAPKLVFARRSSLTGVRINPYQPNYLDIAAMGRDAPPPETRP